MDGYKVAFKNEPGTCTHYETTVWCDNHVDALTRATADFKERNSKGRRDDMTEEEMKATCVHITPYTI